jgi:hypothetical protein
MPAYSLKNVANNEVKRDDKKDDADNGAYGRAGAFWTAAFWTAAFWTAGSGVVMKRPLRVG